MDEATFDRVYAVNVKSIYLGAVHAVPVFRSQGSGNILNVASTAGVRPRPGLTWYNGSKGAAILLTKSMAVELAPDKIRVNAVNPVMGETGLLGHFLPAGDAEAGRQKVISTIPLGRLSQPMDIAKACAFLVSDEADFITGVCMEVDGGPLCLDHEDLHHRSHSRRRASATKSSRRGCASLKPLAQNSASPFASTILTGAVRVTKPPAA